MSLSMTVTLASGACAIAPITMNALSWYRQR
jgi:hypothetical protein